MFRIRVFLKAVDLLICMKVQIRRKNFKYLLVIIKIIRPHGSSFKLFSSKIYAYKHYINILFLDIKPTIGILVLYVWDYLFLSVYLLDDCIFKSNTL